ncbi:hypothetical protein [Chondromyces crocatus]|uniref:Secreted protein n=1 Tax=Chondromyces crocatus TaxID=52 RepID=A0A0K1E5T1_CHOCO|nr:hypothetical protein [Chondromyces crocatus]AKT36199.1 uncharacterized protein CMC5_003130 [Chondromyces crocatus]
MRRPTHAIAATAALLLATADAGAQAVPPPDPPPPDHSIEDLLPIFRPATLPDEGLLPSRKHEITVALPQSFVSQGGALRFRSGISAEVVPWSARDLQSVRVSLYGAGLLGTWSDGASLRPLVEGGVRMRLSLLPSEIIDVYALLGAGVIAGGDGNAKIGLRASQGGGIRLFRALFTEIAVDYLFALDRPFLHTGQPHHDAMGLSTHVGFDLCSIGTFCDHPPILQERDDRTCCVYDQARSICEAARTSGASSPLCASVEAALDARRHAVLAGEAPFDRFLLAVAQELTERASVEANTTDPDAPPQNLRPALAALLADLHALKTSHGRLTGWRERGRAQERSLAQRRKVIRRKRVYAPYANELLRALGCGWEPASVGVCRDVCDTPSPGADPCALAR